MSNFRFISTYSIQPLSNSQSRLAREKNRQGVELKIHIILARSDAPTPATYSVMASQQVIDEIFNALKRREQKFRRLASQEC